MAILMMVGVTKPPPSLWGEEAFVWLIQCTKKLRQEMGIADRAIAISASVPTETGSEWYADLVRIGSKKVVVFTHADTLFSVVALQVRREGIRLLDQLLRDRLPQVLKELDIPESSLKVIEGWGVESCYAPTASRQVLGSMNDQIRSLKFYIESAGGLECCNEVSLSLRLSDMIMSAINYERPSDRFTRFLMSAAVQCR